MHLCMATKTISVDLEAYERMSRARKHPRESFSQVIHRAVWIDGPRNGKRLLELMKSLPPASDEEIARLDDAQKSDLPPDDPWLKS
jgi:predicted CopG family antitoxin